MAVTIGEMLLWPSGMSWMVPLASGCPFQVTFPDTAEGPVGPVTIQLPTARCTPAVVEQLRFVLGNHPGMSEVRMKLLSPQGVTMWKLADKLRVRPSPSLMADLKALLGPSCVGAA